MAKVNISFFILSLQIILCLSAEPFPNYNECGRPESLSPTKASDCFVWGNRNCCFTQNFFSVSLCVLGSPTYNKKVDNEAYIKSKFDAGYVVCPDDIVPVPTPTPPPTPTPAVNECGVTSATPNSDSDCTKDMSTRCCLLRPLNSKINNKVCVKAGTGFDLSAKRETVENALNEKFPDFSASCGFSKLPFECGKASPISITDCTEDKATKCCVGMGSDGRSYCVSPSKDTFAKKETAEKYLYDKYDGEFNCGKNKVPATNECGTNKGGKNQNGVECYNDKSTRCCLAKGLNGNTSCLVASNDVTLSDKLAEQKLFDSYEAKQEDISCKDPFPVENQCGLTGGPKVPPSHPSYCYYDKDNKCCYLNRNDRSICVLSPDSSIRFTSDAERLLQVLYPESKVYCGEFNS